MASPTTIHLLLLNGDPDGPRKISDPTRAGIGLIIPRSLFSEYRNRPEFKQPGVYILIGENEKTQAPAVYVGQTGVAGDRLKNHERNKDFWTKMFVFTSPSLGKTHIHFLEATLCDIAKKVNRSCVENERDPKIKAVTEEESAVAESFLKDILFFLPIVGIDYFSFPKKKDQSENEYFFMTRSVAAQGYESANGFTVREGARAIKKEKLSCAKVVIRTRKQLIQSGILLDSGDHYTMTQDYEFTSPSLAGACMVASSCNGRVAWKTKGGKTLKQIQDARG